MPSQLSMRQMINFSSNNLKKDNGNVKCKKYSPFTYNYVTIRKAKFGSDSYSFIFNFTQSQR